MDPTATFAIVQDWRLDKSERRTAALNLLVWLANGGAAPRQSPNSSAKRAYNAEMWKRLVVIRCEKELVEAIEQAADAKERQRVTRGDHRL